MKDRNLILLLQLSHDDGKQRRQQYTPYKASRRLPHLHHTASSSCILLRNNSRRDLYAELSRGWMAAQRGTVVSYNNGQKRPAGVLCDLPINLFLSLSLFINGEAASGGRDGWHGGRRSFKDGLTWYGAMVQPGRQYRNEDAYPQARLSTARRGRRGLMRGKEKVAIVVYSFYTQGYDTEQGIK